ncbi:MAG: alanine--tRNA ligase [Gammaproteobacteria bacterium]|nr:alanine--tRNA ligase [Gammaproteobacteria bacterium]
MKYIEANDIRRRFLDYFSQRGHEVVASSPLVPAADPTLLFTNAGMVQFKDVFLGSEPRACPRAVTAQRCVRAGGKHNDLENVGYTARHHTFFEMLGNFSFGDYFKEQAIRYAWEFLTGELAIPEEKLWVTVYKDDNEAEDIWLRQVGIDRTRFSRCGERDNFWSMGDTGPCGPCSEIFYDYGAEVPGGPPGSADQDGDRYVEIWNLVFMEFNRDEQGNLHPLPQPSVDTGMGLERVAALLQGVRNNYDTDLFRPLIEAVQSLAGNDGDNLVSTRVIADHIRASAFLVADGVMPGNEGRGYVLRRIIRRALRHGSKLGLTEPFFHKLVAPLISVMGATADPVSRLSEFVTNTLKQEEERFTETLQQGLKHLEAALETLSARMLPGEVIFKLYDTYGFPVDLTADIAREQGLDLDQAGFEACMEEQRQRSRGANKFRAVEVHPGTISMGELKVQGSAEAAVNATTFTGYNTLQDTSQIMALWHDEQTVASLAAGQSGRVLLDRTPFYAESGGQVGDKGKLEWETGEFVVEDTQQQGNHHWHLGTVTRGALQPGQQVSAQVDELARADTIRNHSATHLLHAALRTVLGEHVTQQGSLVAPDRLRFDFSHPQPVATAQLAQIEQLVNRKILENVETQIRLLPLAEALQSGAMSLFGEKYDEEVRVLNIGGDFSVELCGGTHVQRSGDIGLFKLVAETGIAAGVRRVEAVTGTGALAWVAREEAQLAELARLLKSGRDKLAIRLEQVLENARRLEKELEQVKGEIASRAGAELSEQAELVNGIAVLARNLAGADPKTLRDTVDRLKSKLGTAAIVLGTVQGDKVSLVAGVTKDSTDRVKAGDLVNYVARQVGGKGGGRPDLAQAGGNDPSALENALASVPAWLREQTA